MANLIKQINKEDIIRVIEHSQNFVPNVDHLLEQWANAKEPMSDIFLGGKVSYTYPETVSFEMGLKAKKEYFLQFMDDMCNALEWCEQYKNTLIPFLRSLDVTEFYKNTLEKPYVISERDNKVIPKGAKVIKSFKYFITDAPDLLSHLQDKASEYIQANKVEGYLTFSIHPLDFLSSSENTYNWRSCHALDGEYRAGNLSYIGDTSTMIVYLSSRVPKKLPNFPDDVLWDSKKWRVLLHFDKDYNVCFASRQYPFGSISGLNVLKEIFDKELANSGRKTGGWWELPADHIWSGWHNDYIKTFTYSKNDETVNLEKSRYCVINGAIFDRYAIVHDAKNARHYNDVLHSTIYLKPYYMFEKHWCAPNTIDITVGSEIMCLRCGEHPIDGHGSMMCSQCECECGDSDSDDYFICDCCGARTYIGNSTYVDDDHICTRCAERETTICPRCGLRVYNENIGWNEENQEYLCRECNRELRNIQDQQAREADVRRFVSQMDPLVETQNLEVVSPDYTPIELDMNNLVEVEQTPLSEIEVAPPSHIPIEPG